MIDRETREACEQTMFDHRVIDDTFHCACGWVSDGFGDPWRAHLLDAVLSTLEERGLSIVRTERVAWIVGFEPNEYVTCDEADVKLARDCRMPVAPVFRVVRGDDPQ